MPRRDAGSTCVPLSVVVTEAPCESMHGRAEVIVGAQVKRPIQATWQCITSDQDGDDESMGVSEDGLVADRLACGGRYCVTVVDALGEEHSTRIRVDACRLPVVVAYESQDATTASSRDGAVTVTAHRLPEGCRFLWTSGHTTSAPLLRHVAPGAYAVTLLTAEGSRVPFLHCAEVGVVGVAPPPPFADQ